MAEQQNIKLYIAQNGKAPFQEWLELLKDVKVRAIIRVRLDRMRMGNFGDIKHVGARIYELRIQYGPGYRVYFGRINKNIVLLLCGGSKSSQRKDIYRAHAYWEDYRRRKA